MTDYEKLFFEISDQNIKDALIQQKKKRTSSRPF